MMLMKTNNFIKFHWLVLIMLASLPTCLLAMEQNDGKKNTKQSRRVNSCCHCRESHLKCSKNKPCDNCVLKELQCIVYKKSIKNILPCTNSHGDYINLIAAKLMQSDIADLQIQHIKNLEELLKFLDDLSSSELEQNYNYK